MEWIAFIDHHVNKQFWIINDKPQLVCQGAEPLGFDDMFPAFYRRDKRGRFCSGLGLCWSVLRNHEDMQLRWSWPLWMRQDGQRSFVQRLPLGWMFWQRGLRSGICQDLHQRRRAGERKERRRDARQPAEYKHRIQGKWWQLHVYSDITSTEPNNIANLSVQWGLVLRDSRL